MAFLNPSVYVKTKDGETKTRPFCKTAKMLKKITAEIKAAVMLIVTENLTALRTLFRSVTNSVSKSIGKHQNAVWQNKDKD